MDSVLISGNPNVRDGLKSMMKAAIGENGYVEEFVEVPVALFILEVMIKAQDNKNWFPMGKSATIQAIRGRVDNELRNLFIR